MVCTSESKVDVRRYDAMGPAKLPMPSKDGLKIEPDDFAELINVLNRARPEIGGGGK